MDNKGLTLTELLIYMVLGTLVITYAMSTMKTVSSNYVHGREVTKMQQNGRDAINVLARDLINTGFKYYINKDTAFGTGIVSYDLRPKTGPSATADSLFLYASYLSSYIDVSDPDDSTASFNFTSNATGDQLEIYRSRLVTTDSIDAAERVKYYMSNDTLYREYQSVTNKNPDASGNIQWNPQQTVAIMSDVVGIQYQFSVNGQSGTWVDDPGSNRDDMKYIRVELLIKSQRSPDVQPPTTPIVMGDETFTPDGEHLYRVYSQVVPMFNNGVVQ